MASRSHGFASHFTALRCSALHFSALHWTSLHGAPLFAPHSALHGAPRFASLLHTGAPSERAMARFFTTGVFVSAIDG